MESPDVVAPNLRRRGLGWKRGICAESQWARSVPLAEVGQASMGIFIACQSDEMCKGLASVRRLCRRSAADAWDEQARMHQVSARIECDGVMQCQIAEICSHYHVQIEGSCQVRGGERSSAPAFQLPLEVEGMQLGQLVDLDRQEGAAGHPSVDSDSVEAVCREIDPFELPPPVFLMPSLRVVIRGAGGSYVVRACTRFTAFEAGTLTQRVVPHVVSMIWRGRLMAE